MAKKRIGIIGCGNIAYKHITELKKVEEAQIVALCDIDPAPLKRWADELNIPEERRFSDYRDLIACEEVDAVEICTPNYLHIPMAVDVVKAGKPVNVEKPLSVDLGACAPLKEALAAVPVPNMMCFSYRFMPAVRYARKLLKEKTIGNIISVDVAYLKDSALWAGRKLEWRFVKEYGGTGVLGDLGVHLIDMAELLIGNVQEVCGTIDIVVKERQRLDSEEVGPVETDDYCSFLAKLEGDINAAFTITRAAVGQKNTIKFDIYGTGGVLSFNLNNPNVLGLFVGVAEQKQQEIPVVEVPKEYYLAQEQAFVDLLNGKECDDLPTVADGLHSQRVLDAVLESAEERRWVTV